MAVKSFRIAERTDPRYPLQTVDHALTLLEMLGHRQSLRLSDVSRELNVAPSTAHRLLATLEHRGFARRRDGSRAYLVGPALERIAHDVLNDFDISRTAQPVLEALGRQYHESVLLGVLEPGGVRFIAGRESELPLRVGGHFEQLFPPHTSASGLVLLAGLDDAEVRARYTNERLTTVMPNAIARRVELVKDLRAIRVQNYALVVETTAKGVGAIAVPVECADGRVPAAVTLIAPTLRFTPAKLRGALPALRRAAKRIASDVG